jgi:sugar phosphate isomerase/epimerase
MDEDFSSAPRIATCMIGFSPTTAEGIPMAAATAEEWSAVFAEIRREGFSFVEVNDGWLRPADLAPGRASELVEVIRDNGLGLPAVHIQRVSVVEPSRGDANLAYTHRSIDAAAALGVDVVSTGLHQPFSSAQSDALWFWTAPGPKDVDDPEVRQRAVARIRELGTHAGELGMKLSLELYEDTYLGTAESAVRFIEEVGLRNVGLNPDVGNLIRLHRPVEDWREIYRATLPYANYWHLKNYARDEAGDGSWQTAVPSTLATGVINYREVIADAIAGGYDGVFTCEHYGGDPLTVCGENARYIDRMVANARHRHSAASSSTRPQLVA